MSGDYNQLPHGAGSPGRRLADAPNFGVDPCTADGI
jgi:hypothetical protein